MNYKKIFQKNYNVNDNKLLSIDKDFKPISNISNKNIIDYSKIKNIFLDKTIGIDKTIDKNINEKKINDKHFIEKNIDDLIIKNQDITKLNITKLNITKLNITKLNITKLNITKLNDTNKNIVIQNNINQDIIIQDTINQDIIIQDIINQYFKILKEKPISDHEPVVSNDSKIISWNVQKDASFNEIYSWDTDKNYFKGFTIQQIEQINKIYGIGENFKTQMESELFFKELTNDRYKKICEKIKSIIVENDQIEKNNLISVSKFRICLQECSFGLFKYLEKNLGFKYIKFISQDIDNIFVGRIDEFCKDIEYILNWYELPQEKKKNKSLNQLVLTNNKWKEYQKDLEKKINNHMKNGIKNNKKLNKSNKKNNKKDNLFDKSLISEEWKKFILNDYELWNKFINWIEVKNIKNENEDYKKSSGSVIISNYPFIILPCFTRMLYTNCIISSDKSILNSYGSFCIKARGCICIDLEYKKNPTLINVHFPKHRVGTDYLKILENDFFSFNFEITNQIHKYFFCTGESLGLDKLLSNIYFNKLDCQNKFKNVLLSSIFINLKNKFVDKIYESNNSKKDIIDYNRLIGGFDIFLNDNINCNFNIESNICCDDNLDDYYTNTFNKNENKNEKQYYLDMNSINMLLEKIKKNKKIFIVGDFNCGLEKIILTDKKYYLDKYIEIIKNMNIQTNSVNFDNEYEYLDDIVNKKYSNILKKHWTISKIINSSKIDHIIEIEYIENNSKFIDDIAIIYSKLSKNIINQISSSVLKKKANIISLNADCAYKKEVFGIKKNYNIDIDKNFIDKNFIDKNTQANIIGQILLDMLFNFKINLIIKELEDNITFSNNNIINNKIYLQNISYHFVDIIKNKSLLNFKYIKFIGETISSVYLHDLKKYFNLSLEEINFPKRYNENIYKLYNDYNKFGFCILSNEPFFFIPCNPVCYIKLSSTNTINKDINLTDLNHKTSLNIFIKTNACIDLTSSVIIINENKNFDEYVNGNSINCSNLLFNNHYILDKYEKEYLELEYLNLEYDNLKDSKDSKELKNSKDSNFQSNELNLVYIIKYLRFIILNKYIETIIDINKEDSEFIIQDYLKKNYDISTILSQPNNLQVKILSDKFINSFEKINKNNKNNQLICLGQYSKKNTIDELKNIIDEYKKKYNNKLINYDEIFSKDKYKYKNFDTIQKITFDDYLKLY